MSALVYFEALAVLVLILVAFAAITQWAERRSPRLRRWLDRHVGEEPDWMRPW